MTTVRELSAWIGTQVYVEPVPGLRFFCRVSDAKISYGRPRLQIEAVAGEGKAWVAQGSVAPVDCARHGQPAARALGHPGQGGSHAASR
jgi:hypothetical protein